MIEIMIYSVYSSICLSNKWTIFHKIL